MNDNAQSAKSVDHFWELFALMWVAVSAMQLANWDNRAFWDGDTPWPLFLFQLSFTLSGGLLLTLLWKSFYTMHAQQRAASAMGYLVLFVITVLGLGGYVYTIGPRKPVPEPNKLTAVSLEELMREPGKHHDQFVAIEGWIRYGTFLSDSDKFLYTLHPENPTNLPWSLDGRTNLIIVAKRALDGIDSSGQARRIEVYGKMQVGREGHANLHLQLWREVPSE